MDEKEEYGGRKQGLNIPPTLKIMKNEVFSFRKINSWCKFDYIIAADLLELNFVKITLKTRPTEPDKWETP